MFEVESRRLPYALMLALLLSALLHVLVSLVVHPRIRSDEPLRRIFPELAIELRGYARPASAEEIIPIPPVAAPTDNSPGDVTSPATENATTAAPRTQSPTAAATSTAITHPQLDLSLPTLEAAPVPRSPISGTVFNAGLVTRIAAERRRRFGAGASAGRSLALGADTTSYSGGQWESVLRVGDLCFRVIEANPLDALSNEQWFRVDCD